MSDEKALLAAIWEYPHEDTPRLMYADWLEEHGQPERAEFIRVQCELARLDEWDEEKRPELLKYEKKLWKKHAKTWKAGLSPYLQKLGGFVRGFPSPQRRAMTAMKFLKLTEADFAGAPLWNFSFPSNHKLLPKLLASPLLRRVGTLDFRFWIETADDMRLFATSPNVRNIAELSLDGCKAGDDGMTELTAGAEALPHLWKLNLEFNDLTARAMTTLVNSPLANGLRDLRLFYNRIGADGVRAIANATRFARLESLDITKCEEDSDSDEEATPITGETIAELCASPHLAAVKELALDPFRFGVEDVRAVCETRPAFRLVKLQLSSGLVKFGDAGAEVLAEWPALADVRVLYLYGNDISAAGARALAKSPYLNNITQLRLDWYDWQDDAATMKILRDRFGDAVSD